MELDSRPALLVVAVARIPFALEVSDFPLAHCGFPPGGPDSVQGGHPWFGHCWRRN